MLPVTPVSKQLSLEATSENTSLTSDSLTHTSHKELHNLNGDITFVEISNTVQYQLIGS